MEKTRLIIFAREPRVGRVKTRLLKSLPPLQVTSLYKAFIKDVLNAAKVVPCHERVIYYTGARSPRFLKKYKKLFQYQRQKGKDLGQRMLRAFVESVKGGFERTVIIGTDTPHLDPALISRAFAALEHRDVVLGPARDGGYYLIGLKEFSSILFSRIRWGTSQVLNSTLTRARKLKMKIYLLPLLGDIDTVRDLKEFSRNPKVPTLAPHSWKAAKNLF